jgi:hypothetical protein
MTPAQKDSLSYIGAGAAGALLAKSFGLKALGILIGGTGGVVVAAWYLIKPKTA